ncbi:MAG: hypothetical protein ACW98F_17100 [Candidatus Hodarchaeales archaeon]|jgi:hypothetical protein
MLRKTIVTLFISMIFSSSLVNVSSTVNEVSEFEWMVAVGDSMTYTYTKCFDSDDSDKDGDMYSRIYSTTTSDGEPVEISIKKGVIIRVEIWEIGLFARINVTLNGIPTGMDETESTHFFHGFVVDMTVNSQAYWENKSFQYIDHSYSDITIIESAFVQGDYFLQVTNVTSNTGTYFLRIRKTNWKTGWFAYEYERYFNETHLIREYEISTEIQGIFANLNLGRIFIPALFLLSLMTILIMSKRKRKYF